jgi:predicted oxidoreductase (fatty acid repression mutant protein)
MSDYTQVSFNLPNNRSVILIGNALNKLWGPSKIFANTTGEWQGELVITISELSLKESLFILDKLHDKFGLVFYIEYGMY